MKCKVCNSTESKVIDSRPSEDGLRIRRRRECIDCGLRFTTYEIVETISLIVIKKDGTLQAFDRQKLLNGLINACTKRPVSIKEMEAIIDRVEKVFENNMIKEIPSTKIGDLVLEQLKDYDEIAYIRFASVYRDFKDITTFIEELKKLKKS